MIVISPLDIPDAVIGVFLVALYLFLLWRVVKLAYDAWKLRASNVWRVVVIPLALFTAYALVHGIIATIRVTILGG